MVVVSHVDVQMRSLQQLLTSTGHRQVSIARNAGVPGSVKVILNCLTQEVAIFVHGVMTSLATRKVDLMQRRRTFQRSLHAEELFLHYQRVRQSITVDHVLEPNEGRS